MGLIKKLKTKFKSRLQSDLLLIRESLSKETGETRDMIITYLRFTQGKASKKQMEDANEQFRSFLKAMGLGTLAILPLAPLTIPLIVKIGRKMGIDIIPNSFKSPKD